MKQNIGLSKVLFLLVTTRKLDAPNNTQRRCSNINKLRDHETRVNIFGKVDFNAVAHANSFTLPEPDTANKKTPELHAVGLMCTDYVNSLFTFRH
jgi:hypothetical protein